MERKKKSRKERKTKKSMKKFHFMTFEARVIKFRKKANIASGER